MEAEWNVYKIAEMGEEQNLRNTCRQLEQSYVDWARRATHAGSVISREWPAIGELGRGTVAGKVLEFVTTRKRTIRVIDAGGRERGEVRMLPGMASELYALAGSVVDLA